MEAGTCGQRGGAFLLVLAEALSLFGVFLVTPREAGAVGAAFC